MFDDKTPGPYNVLYDRLITDIGANVILTMLPIRRATRIFSARGADCMFVGSPEPTFYIEFGMIEEEIIHSETVMAISLKIYSPLGSAPIEDASVLNTVNFAIDSGVGDVSYLKDVIPHKETGLLVASNLVDGFKLLDQGRIKALIAIDIDVRTLQSKNAKYGSYPVSDTFVLRQSEDVFVCRKSPRTERFINNINVRIGELRSRGQIDDIFTQ